MFSAWAVLELSWSKWHCCEGDHKTLEKGNWARTDDQVQIGSAPQRQCCLQPHTLLIASRRLSDSSHWLDLKLFTIVPAMNFIFLKKKSLKEPGKKDDILIHLLNPPFPKFSLAYNWDQQLSSLVNQSSLIKVSECTVLIVEAHFSIYNIYVIKKLFTG